MRGVQRDFPKQKSFRGHKRTCLEALACWRLGVSTPTSLCLEALTKKFLFTTLQQCGQLPSLHPVIHNIFFPYLQTLSSNPSRLQRNCKRTNSVARSVLVTLGRLPQLCEPESTGKLHVSTHLCSAQTAQTAHLLCPGFLSCLQNPI